MIRLLLSTIVLFTVAGCSVDPERWASADRAATEYGYQYNQYLYQSRVENEIEDLNGYETFVSNESGRRVEDELDNLPEAKISRLVLPQGGYKNFATATGGTPQRYYNLNTDQMMHNTTTCSPTFGGAMTCTTY